MSKYIYVDQEDVSIFFKQKKKITKKNINK